MFDNKREKLIKKTRDIPLTEYFSLLQLEWLSYRFRQLLYVRNFDIELFKNFCKRKAKTVESVARKNCLPSILNSDAQREKYLKRFLNDNESFPQFQYRDDYQKKIKGYWDKYYYYLNSNSFIYTMTNEKCNIERFDIDQNFSLINTEGKEYPVQLDKVIRVFTEDFVKEIWKFE